MRPNEKYGDNSSQNSPALEPSPCDKNNPIAFHLYGIYRITVKPKGCPLILSTGHIQITPCGRKLVGH